MDLHDMFFINKKLGLYDCTLYFRMHKFYSKSNSSFVHVPIVDLYSAISLVPIRECVSCQTKTINTKSLMNTPTKRTKNRQDKVLPIFVRNRAGAAFGRPESGKIR